MLKSYFYVDWIVLDVGLKSLNAPLLWALHCGVDNMPEKDAAPRMDGWDGMVKQAGVSIEGADNADVQNVVCWFCLWN